MKTAFIFPGQASQFVGMGLDLHDEYKEIFEFADHWLGYKLSDIMFRGPPETLTITKHTQPALMLHSYVVLQMLKKHGIHTQNTSSYIAGHSLGEYSALTASESLNLQDALTILKIRGEAMHNAAPHGVGGMIAILGSPASDIEQMIQEANIPNHEICQIANDNNANQVVVSGHNTALERLTSIVTKTYNKRAIKLNVSAPFHSKFMSSATQILSDNITNITIKDSTPPLVSNVTAQAVTKAYDIQRLLIQQIEHRVRWHECVQYMISQGVYTFVEIGSGSVLSGIIKKINRDVTTLQVSNHKHIEQLEKHL